MNAAFFASFGCDGFAGRQQQSSTFPTVEEGDRVLLAAIVLSALAACVLGTQFVEVALAWSVSALLTLLAVIAYTVMRGTLVSRFVLTFVQVSMVALHVQLAQGMIEFHFGVFVTLALSMGRTARESAELRQLAMGLLRNQSINLDVANVRVASDGAAALQKTLQRMHHAVATVQGSASTMALACREISSGAQDLSQRTEQAASTSQETAAHLEHLRAAVAQSTQLSQQASNSAKTSADVAQRGGEAVAQVVGLTNIDQARHQRGFSTHR